MPRFYSHSRTSAFLRPHTAAGEVALCVLTAAGLLVGTPQTEIFADEGYAVSGDRSPRADGCPGSLALDLELDFAGGSAVPSMAGLHLSVRLAPGVSLQSFISQLTSQDLTTDFLRTFFGLVQSAGVRWKEGSFAGITTGPGEVVLSPGDPSHPAEREIELSVSTVGNGPFHLHSLAGRSHSVDGSLQFRLGAVFNPGDLPVHLDASLPRGASVISFAAALEPRRFLNETFPFAGLEALADLVFTGELAAFTSGSYDLNTGDWHGAIRVPVTDWHLAHRLGDWTLEGLSAEIHLLADSTGVFTTAQPVKLKVDRILAATFQLEDLRARLSVAGTDAVLVEGLRFRLGGGEVGVGSFQINPSAPNDAITLTLAIEGIAMEFLSTLLSAEWNIQAEGPLGGTLTMRLSPGSLAILPSHLSLQSGVEGRLRYRNPGWLTGPEAPSPNLGSNAALQAAEEAFEDLRLQQFRIDWNDSRTAATPAVVTVIGSGRSSRLNADVPVNTTINLSYDPDELMALPLVNQLQRFFFTGQ